MKRIIFILLFLAQYSWATTSLDLFKVGNELYKKEKYEQALNVYVSILEQNKDFSADLYFNIGNCHYMLNHVAESIYYYEKALQFEPKNDSFLTNLELANQKKIDKIKQIEASSFEKIFSSIANVFSIDGWAKWCVLFSFLTLIFFSIFIFSDLKRVGITGGVLSLLFFIITFIIAYVTYNSKKNNKAAIVFAEKVEVKLEPKNKSETKITLHEGSKVFVMETQNNWKRVQLTDKTEGWINSDAIKSLD